MCDADSNSFWSSIFGNDHPVDIEIGPGAGTFLLSVAAEHPERNYFAIEHSRGRALSVEAAVAAGDLRNVRIIHADASCVVGTLIPAASVAAYHIYFPDPWWKRRHHRRRLFTPDFAGALARTLAPMGRVYVASDVADVFAVMRTTLTATHALAEIERAPSPRRTVTSFERKGVARGATIRQATFAKDDAGGPHSPPSMACPTLDLGLRWGLVSRKELPGDAEQ
jgi:tRNA (guanine-N7-)-methyltransferase